jgi:hypothetical protein
LNDRGTASEEPAVATANVKQLKEARILPQDQAWASSPSLQSLTAKLIASTIPSTPNSAIDTAVPIAHTVDSSKEGQHPTADNYQTPVAADKCFTTSELAYLTAKGYTVADVLGWARILSVTEMESAILHLSSMLHFQQYPAMKNVQNESHLEAQRQHSQVPLFVVIFLLRRVDINSESLSRLLEISWQILQHTDKQSTSNNQIFILFSGLLRHARKVWPASFLNIATLLTTFMPPRGKVGISAPERALYTNMYNRALHLISMTTSSRPYLSCVPQEDAQFHLLGAMARFEPPLQLTRTGFRAVIRVQLAHKKTEQEKDWASLKSKSWPPWSVPRTRMDEEKGFEYGKSRAHRTLEWMRSAGYCTRDWQDIALIYAGWQKNGTPTIQTRKLLDHSLTGRTYSHGAGLWHAKIQATRTLREAWSCFLSYTDTQRLRHAYVYEAMFEKIIWDQKREDDPDSMLPGDGKETVPPPTSPMETIYLRSEPPGFMEFFNQMRNDGITPRGNLLRLLLAWSPSMEDAIVILRQAFGPNFETTLIRSASTRTEMTDSAFAGLVHLCSRLPDSQVLNAFFSEEQLAELCVTLKLSSRISRFQAYIQTIAVYHAFHLAVTRRSVQLSVWNDILSGLQLLSQQQTSYSDHYPSVLHVLQTMESLSVRLDETGFGIYCNFVSHTAEWAQRTLSRTETLPDAQTGYLRNTRSWASEILAGSEGLRLEEAFYKLVGRNTDEPAPSLPMGDSKRRTPPLPRLLTTPSPNTCHNYVRALGALGDHNGLCQFVSWIAINEAELRWLVDEEMGGRRRWRRMLTAIRVYLEARAIIPAEPLASHARPVELPRASEDQLSLVKNTLESMDSLGEWPSDDEVDDYVRSEVEQRWRFPTARDARN